MGLAHMLRLRKCKIKIYLYLETLTKFHLYRCFGIDSCHDEEADVDFGVTEAEFGVTEK